MSRFLAETHVARYIAEVQAAGIVVCLSAANDGPSALTIGDPGLARNTLTVGGTSIAAYEKVLRDLQFGLGTGALWRANDTHQTIDFSSRGPTADGRYEHHQFAVLYRGGEKVQMSTRSGEFVTLRELRQEVGNDAARFFYVLRKCEQHMDFDLDLAKSQSSDNPVYYIQYAHARVASVLRQLQGKGLQWDAEAGRHELGRLTESHEDALLVNLSRYPEIVESAAVQHEPHQLAHYLRELANDLHTYYNAHQFLVADEALRNARLNLIAATRQVLANGLGLLGVSAPDSM